MRKCALNISLGSREVTGLVVEVGITKLRDRCDKASMEAKP